MSKDWDRWRQLFAKLLYAPLDTINFQIIEEFCHNPAIQNSSQPESNLVEYKGWTSSVIFKSFTEKIVKEIVSFANTDGGLIFIGVGEEKDIGGRRDYAGEVGTLPLEQADSLKQSIEASCQNLINPSFVPEIHIIPHPGTDKSVLLIRIDLDKIPRPLLFKIGEGKWMPFIRVGTNQVVPTWDEILLIAKKRYKTDELMGRQEKENEGPIEFTISPFWYCSIQLILNKRYHSRWFGTLQHYWTSEDAEKLKKAVNSKVKLPGKIGESAPCTQVFHPKFSRVNPLGFYTDFSTEKIMFSPVNGKNMFNGQDKTNKYYQLIFERDGIMKGFIGTVLDNPPGILLGDIFKKVYYLVELFLRQEVLEQYRYDFQTESKATLRARIGFYIHKLNYLSLSSFFEPSNYLRGDLLISGSPFEEQTNQCSPEQVSYKRDFEIVLAEETPLEITKKITELLALNMGLLNIEKKIRNISEETLRIVFLR